MGLSDDDEREHNNINNNVDWVISSCIVASRAVEKEFVVQVKCIFSDGRKCGIYNREKIY